MNKKEKYELENLREENERCKKLILQLSNLVKSCFNLRQSYNPKDNITCVEITYYLQGKITIRNVLHLSEVLEND